MDKIELRLSEDQLNLIIYAVGYAARDTSWPAGAKRIRDLYSWLSWRRDKRFGVPAGFTTDGHMELAGQLALDDVSK